MNISQFLSLNLNLPLFQTYGYPLILILNILEGPIVTYFAAFAASIGVFNVYYVFILSLLGNFISDTAVFLLGRFGRKTFLAKFFLKPKYKQLKKLRHHFENNMLISLSIVKLINPIATPGLAFAGMTNVSFKKFLVYVLLAGVPFAVLFTALGYYSGIAYNVFANYLKIGEIAIFIAFIIFILIFFFYKRLSAYMLKYVKS